MHGILQAGRYALALGLITSITLCNLGSARLRPVVAATTPHMSLTLTTVPLGTQVGLSGAGFAANEPLTVTLSGLSAPLNTLTARPDGTVPQTALTIPATVTVGSTVLPVAPGPHTLLLSGATSALTASATLTLIPSATARPDALALGSQVTIAGAGFAANEQVAVAIDGRAGPLATLTAGVDGLIPPTALTIPATTTVGTATSALAVGMHTLTLSGASSARAATVQVRLEPSATVSPETSAAGAPVTVSGAGFAAYEQVSVALSGTAGPLATLMADNNGVVAGATVVIPASAPLGTHLLTLTGAWSQLSASAPLTLTAPEAAATLIVAPDTAAPGSRVTVSGSGFAANEAVSISASGRGTPLATLTSDAQGQLAAADLILPVTLPLGAHTLQATGALSGRGATTSLTVVALDPVIRVTPTMVSPGDTVTIIGQGFAAQEQVAFALNGAALPAAPAIVTTGAGAFTATLVLPNSVLDGANTISTIGSESRVSASFVVRGIHPVATTLYFAGAATEGGLAAPLTPASGIYWRLLAPMNLRPAPSLAPTSHLLVPQGTTVKEWGPQPSPRWIHVTWQGHDGYLLTGNMLPRGLRVAAPDARESLAILNTGPYAAHIALTFYNQQGAITPHARLIVAAHSRGTADLTRLAGRHDVLGLTLRADRAVSAQLAVRQGGQDSAVILGVPAPATTWYLSAGASGATVHEALTLVNPGMLTAWVQVRLVPGAGHAMRVVTVGVPPQCARVVDVSHLMPAQAAGVIATASRPIILARTITFGPTGASITAKAGILTPATRWSFARGQMAGRARTQLSILNPTAQGAFVTASVYAQAGGALGSRTLYVRGLTRAMLTLSAGSTARAGGIVVSSDRPVVVEQLASVRLPRGADVAASDVVGRNGAGLQWAFPAGDTHAGRALLSLFNPSPRTAVIAARFYGSNGQVVTWPLTLPPTRQGVIDVTALALAPTPRYGVTLQATNGVGFVAEQTLLGPGGTVVQSSQGVGVAS